ncbi:hypothetical protein FRC12_004923 [Ceratobasidium sp. 428]|nr:hypothetical protein FRC12_004923 [Ceratobasidium sp. 428]
MSVARYLNAILALAAHIRYLPRGARTVQNLNNSEEGALTLLDESLIPVNIDTGLPISPFKLLAMTESLWANDRPRFSADTYASLLVAGVEIMQLVVSTHFGNYSQIRKHYQKTTERSSIKPHATAIKGAHVIDSSPPNKNSDSSNRLSDLRAHYSRWLIRVSTMICLHANSEITIGTRQLDKLLHSLTVAAGIDLLNPLEHTSTHHPQSEVPGQRAYRFIVPFGKDRRYTIQSDDLRMGPLGSILDLLRMRPGLKDESFISTQRAALVAYAALAPVLMQQVLGSSREELQIALDIDSLPSASRSGLSGTRYTAMRQTLITARYLAHSRMKNPLYAKYALDVFRLMDACVAADDASSSFEFGALLALARHSDDIIPMLEFAGESDKNLKLLPRRLQYILMDIAQLVVEGQYISPLEHTFTPSCYPPLLRMIKSAKYPSDGVKDVLQAMIRRMRSGDSSNHDADSPRDRIPPIQFLFCFTHEPLAFTLLAHAGTQRQYVKPVVTFITQVVHLAANRDPALTVDPVELRPPAVRGFLDAVSVVAKYCSGVSDKSQMLMEFFDDAFTLLKVASEDTTSKEVLVNHIASQDMWDALNRVKGDSTTLEMAKTLQNVGERLGMTFKGE